FYFLFNDPASPELYTLSLHDALPILTRRLAAVGRAAHTPIESGGRTMYRLLAASLVVALTNMSSAAAQGDLKQPIGRCATQDGEDRKSTRLNSSHVAISYAVFCLKKK